MRQPFIPSYAKHIHTGKTKTIYTLGDEDNEPLMMVFNEGTGYKNLAMTAYLHNKLKKDLHIKSYIIDADLENHFMITKKTKPFGNGLNFIATNKAYGNFLERNKAYIQGDSMLDELGRPFIEISEKNGTGSLFLSPPEHIQRRTITPMDYAICTGDAKDIGKNLTELFSHKGICLVDLKLEFEKYVYGGIMLTGEISPDSFCALQCGKPVSKDEIYDAILGKAKSENIMDNAACIDGNGAVTGQKSATDTFIQSNGR